MRGAPPLPSHDSIASLRDGNGTVGSGAVRQPASRTMTRSGSFLSGGALIANLRARAARFENFTEGRGRHGPREEESLRRLAAARAQELELRARFHAFGR